jgi:hypothetical protein
MNNIVVKQLNTGECIFSYVKLNSNVILLLTGKSALAYFLDINDLHISKKMIFPGRDCNMNQYKYLCNQNYFVFQNKNGFYFYLPESFTYIGFCPRKYDNNEDDQNYYKTTLIGDNLLTYDLGVENNRINYFVSNLKKQTDFVSLTDAVINDVVMLNYILLVIFTERKIFLYNTKTKSFLKTFESRGPCCAIKSRYFKSKIIAFVENSYSSRLLTLYNIKNDLLMCSSLNVSVNTGFCFNDKHLFTYGSNEKGVQKINLETLNCQNVNFRLSKDKIVNLYCIGINQSMIQTASGMLIYDIKSDLEERCVFAGYIDEETELNDKSVYSDGKYFGLIMGDTVLLYDKLQQRELRIQIPYYELANKILKIEKNEIYLMSMILFFVLTLKKTK